MTMNAKKWLVAAIVLNTALAASLCLTGQPHRGGNHSRTSALTGSIGKFGPMIEAVLPVPKAEKAPELLDLETGRAVLQPPVEDFNASGEATMDWIRSNGLDISCFVW